MAKKKKSKSKEKAGPVFVAKKKLAVCTDGKPVSEFEKEGAKKAGLSVEEWRKKVIETLKAADKKSVSEAFAKGEGTSWASQASTMADRFNAVGKGMEDMTWDSPDKLQDMLEGKTPGLEAMGVDIKGYTQYKRPMWTYLKKHGLVEDRNWQHTSAVSWVDKAGKRHYATNMIPYVVRRTGTSYNFAKGTIIKLVDGNDPNNVAYAQVLGVGPKGDPKLELSQGAWGYLGYEADGKSVPAGAGSVGYQEVVPGGLSSRDMGAMLTGDQIQLAGALGDAGLLQKAGKAVTVDDINKAVDGLDDAKMKRLDKSLNEGARREIEKRQKEKGKKEADASLATGGGPRLMKGFETVLAGPEMRKVGYANAKCVHEAGGHVKEGSECVFVGKWPLARIGDGTSDDLEVKTGNETIFVGGQPSSATLTA